MQAFFSYGYVYMQNFKCLFIVLFLQQYTNGCMKQPSQYNHTAGEFLAEKVTSLGTIWSFFFSCLSCTVRTSLLY